MSYMFGLGPGWLGKDVDTIARKHDAELVNYTDPQCTCGHGCSPHECRRSRRHWFTTQDLGQPFNGATARAVMEEISVRRS